MRAVRGGGGGGEKVASGENGKGVRLIRHDSFLSVYVECFIIRDISR